MPVADLTRHSYQSLIFKAYILSNDHKWNDQCASASSQGLRFVYGQPIG